MIDPGGSQVRYTASRVMNGFSYLVTRLRSTCSSIALNAISSLGWMKRVSLSLVIHSNRESCLADILVDWMLDNEELISR